MSTSSDQFLAALRTKHDGWTSSWQARHAEVDEVLYHYTDAAGLLGIVREGELWASHAAFLNDSTELVYIGGILAELAQEFRKTYEVEADIRAYAMDAYAKAGRFSDAQRRAASVISILESSLEFALGLFDVYVSCFCSDGDLLSQWRSYPSGGGGYALGLSSTSLLHGGGLLRRVVYEEDAQRQLLRDLLAPIVDAVASPEPQLEESGANPMEVLIREHLGAVSASIAECGFCFKHPGSKEESEWRLVILRARDPKRRPDDSPPLVRATPSGLVPYVTRALAEDVIANVLVGPNSQPKLAADAAVQLLSNAGYVSARNIVAHSEIPLRV